jgi:hypothetical protein
LEDRLTPDDLDKQITATVHEEAAGLIPGWTVRSWLLRMPTESREDSVYGRAFMLIHSPTALTADEWRSAVSCWTYHNVSYLLDSRLLRFMVRHWIEQTRSHAEQRVTATP